MNPTARLLRGSGDTGSRLVLTRTFRAPIDDVWASLTEPERTARWFGPWKGRPGAGNTIQVQMVHEDQTPWMDMRIDACEPPRRLACSSTDEYGIWRLEALLTESDGTTTLEFAQHLQGEDNLGEIGPGWEYYLDMLVASRDGSPSPDFDDYFPAMKAYFDGLTAEPER
ncbi:MAG: SRPBCC family protein [Thermoactinospora sp.]|nr:SRPBCC family protein [Thermoactinospora sp.]